MKKFWQLVVMASVLMGWAIPGWSSDWKFPVGLSYVTGFDDVGELYKENLHTIYSNVNEDHTVPIGITFSPYIEFDSGVGLGGTIGPVEDISGGADLFNLPVGLNVRYFLFPNATASLYVRGGVNYNIASGDYVDSSIPGLAGGIGLEMLRNRHVGISCEVLYDSSEIEFERLSTGGTKKVKPSEWVFSLQAVF